MKYNPVGWFEIYVQDMGRAKAFYETVFGVELVDPENEGIDMRMFPMVPEGKGSCGALVRSDGVPSGGNSTMVYFSCEDCATEAGRIAGAGGKVAREKMSIGEYGFVALAYDTEGNMIGLHSKQ